MGEIVHNWQVFQGKPTQDGERIKELPPPPSWRRFRSVSKEQNPYYETYHSQISAYWEQLQELAETDRYERDRSRGQNFRISAAQSKVIPAVNAAFSLRRPLLITGMPGSGKTSLAYAIAYELKLGPVLMWPITARATLETGLYRYDAIARLQDAQMRKQKAEAGVALETEYSIGDYIQLGPLGTAFLPTPHPRILLIDEIDKSDINLPNDLLNLLEEGQFEIPELVRLSKSRAEENHILHGASQRDASLALEPIKVRTADELQVNIEGGKIRCDAFPLIVMTSNGERDFPPAFLRRCLRIEMPKPSEADLQDIVKAHLTKEVTQNINDLIKHFIKKTDQDAQQLATDQLLNAVYLLQYGADLSNESELASLILAALTNNGGNG